MLGIMAKPFALISRQHHVQDFALFQLLWRHKFNTRNWGEGGSISPSQSEECAVQAGWQAGRQAIWKLPRYFSNTQFSLRNQLIVSVMPSRAKGLGIT